MAGTTGQITHHKGFHLNPLWVLVTILILGLGVLIYQTSIIKENTKPESERAVDEYQKGKKIDENLAGATRKNEEYLKTDPGWFTDWLVIKKSQSGELEKIITPGHSVDEFDPHFIDYLVDLPTRIARIEDRGERQVWAGSQMKNLIPYDFGFEASEKEYEYATYKLPIAVKYKDGGEENIFLKVIIAHKGDKKYLYPIKKASF